jgi:hypothetical protein
LEGAAAAMIEKRFSKPIQRSVTPFFNFSAAKKRKKIREGLATAGFSPRRSMN